MLRSRFQCCYGLTNAQWMVLAFLVGCLPMTIALADDPKDETDNTKAAVSPAEQLKENPDNTRALNSYIGGEFSKIRRLIGTDPNAAEKELKQMQSVLDGLQPAQQPAKTLLSRAKAYLRNYQQQIDLARVSIEEIQKSLLSDPSDQKELTRYISKATSEIAPIARSKPDDAEKKLKAVKDFLGELAEKVEGEDEKKRIKQEVSRLASLERSIEARKKLTALIGKDAAPITVDAWVNSDPLTESDLKGKVVLLDFWAVWCGPCIATFPHLRQWHEEYAGKGLVIVGLTRYYNYKWDDGAGRATRSQDKITKEDEHKMLSNFAKEHDLRHAFAVQTDRKLSAFYGVSGIPQVVLIDREGKVRLIRVGSGEANATAVGNMLKELLEGE